MLRYVYRVVVDGQADDELLVRDEPVPVEAEVPFRGRTVIVEGIDDVIQFDHVTSSSKRDHTLLMWPYLDLGDTSGRKLGRGDALGNNSHY